MLGAGPSAEPESARRAAGPPPGEPLPITRAEISALGWDAPDIVLVSGDAYIDHPSFACALIGRSLQAAGYRVAILPQPDWTSVDPFRSLGRPRLFFGVSAGNMDSMLNRYTANRKPRSEDAYTPGGKSGARPDRATNVYAQRCREAFPGVPVIAGGVEASLRRVAHFDYWSDTVKPSILVSSKADLVVYGMGEDQAEQIADRLAAGESVRDLTDIRGTAYLLGARAELPPFSETLRGPGTPDAARPVDDGPDGATVALPSFEEVKADKRAFAVATRLVHRETNPLNARRIVQQHGDRLLVCNPPAESLGEERMDALYDLPYTRHRHPRYREDIPAETMISSSVTIMRGCFGGCSFCSITTHQGRTIQSRSKESILKEVDAVAADDRSKGIISDVGGPTANMWRMRCSSPEAEAVCHRLSCVFPSICRHLDTSQDDLVQLMRESRERPGVRKVHIASGVRMDLAERSPEYMAELVQHHVSGHLKVAPEHVSPRVLKAMKKPKQETFEAFAEKFDEESAKADKEQYLVPYFIAGHPGSTIEDMVDLAVFLKQAGYRPRQVQDFVPAPMDIATCVYHTGLDPHTMEPTPVATRLKDRQAQRALMQFFAPENWHEVHRALHEVGRTELIGTGPQCLIGPKPPPEAVPLRRGSSRGSLRPGSAKGRAGGRGRSRDGRRDAGHQAGGGRSR